MKKSLLILILALLQPAVLLYAQDVKSYKTFIYTSSSLADDIQETNDNQETTRRFDADLLNATLGAVKGIGSGYISTLVDFGVNTIANLITTNARHRQEWEKTIAEENKFNTHISSVQEMRDFYRKPSKAGALDPLDMCFDGIGCLRTEGSDTVFFISCHIDRSKLNRIVNHSKFELVLDTLILSPRHSNLPNSPLPIEWDDSQRKDYTLQMNINLSSSWFTDAIELHNDRPLGAFSITIPVKKEDLDSRGFMRYVRPKSGPDKYDVIGESFIVPRSYMGYRDPDGAFRNIWGTGQYKLDIDISETCDVTDEYRRQWKQDRKMRNKMKPKQGFFNTVWQTISSQKWDEVTRQWVITTLSAPAGVISRELIEQCGMTVPQNPAASSSASAGKGASPAGYPAKK